jgi:hypothetical protein
MAEPAFAFSMAEPAFGAAGRGSPGGASTGGEGPGGGGASTGGEGPGRGELDGCIMHRVHTSMYKKGL